MQISLITAFLALVLPAAAVAPLAQATRHPPPERDVVEQFTKRVDEYVALHRAAERELPPLSDKATPEQLARSRAGLAEAIRRARPAPERGELFVPGMEAYVRILMKLVFSGPEGAAMRETIADVESNPAGLRIAVNDTYPTELPLSTMPPDVLAALPRLPEELEYRFVGTALVLLDTHADLIVDFVPDALSLTTG